MLFAHLKRILRLGRLRLRGPRGAQDEFTLAATAQNLRRLAKFVARPPPQPMAWRVLRKRRLRQSRCVDAEAPCERLGKPATVQWFSWPASLNRSPTFATKSAKSRRTADPQSSNSGNVTCSICMG